ncbi:hypothetical protein [Veronia pacifica]|uniref:Uncharacterized protein n=1 Tax=Veronia pacifica TaxID=1080227 RepID=A0A1C3EBQ0_9GAMM|nr:hypothetical protein [Veronia pacifica]ODA30614.1 hypothetical protein A8L45_19990 [Veronia pacifica]
MSIFYPDNDKRKKRLLELSSDAHHFLSDAKSACADFHQLLPEVNSRIAAVYRKAGLKPPGVHSVDILKTAGVVDQMSKADSVVEVSKVLLDIGGMVATVSYLAPAATAMLVETGALEAETAATVMATVMGSELTVGALAGGIVAGLVAGVVVVGIGFAIDAFEGAEMRDKLRHGIHQADQYRAVLMMAKEKSVALVDMLQAVKTTCDSLLASHITLSEAIIENLIQKNALPAIKEIDAITKDEVLSDLVHLDKSRKSWTKEDKSGHDIELINPKPIYVTVDTPISIVRMPAFPSGLKPVALVNPDKLAEADEYPVLKTAKASYWAASYVDNREGMAILAYDKAGTLLKRWDKPGARYIWRIEENPDNNRVLFVGQNHKKIVMNWAELSSC